MAPLANNLTWRAFIDYFGPVTEHSLLLRLPDNAELNFVLGKATALRDLFQDVLASDYTLTNIRVSAPNTNFSTDFPFTPAVGGAGAIGVINAPRFLSMVGRSTGGRRVRHFFYGVPVELTPDYRVPLGVAPGLTAIYNFIEDANNFVVALDNNFATYKGYFNQGLSAYYQRALRPG